jgi:hypothetical protein
MSALTLLFFARCVLRAVLAEKGWRRSFLDLICNIQLDLVRH